MTQSLVPRTRGRPAIAEHTSQLPATTVPSPMHDAAIREALRRDVSVAQVVRDALFDHLNNRHVPKDRVP